MARTGQHSDFSRRTPACITLYALRFAAVLAFTPALSLFSASIDESKLPPPATNAVDFLRDIKPILDASCLKCHGPERPKSGFRVDDRAALLKGGDSGVSVIPGQSAKSPFIHYVARLVPEMEMPPEGKGDPLTPQQIALLRAWIDQDVPWGGDVAASRTIVDLAPMAGWINVDGDKQKFRELNWMREGWNGGFENFLLQQQLDPDRRFTLEGHALRDDYKITLSLDHAAGRFVRAGFQQYRKYYDDSGGYYSSAVPPQFSLDRDLHLDLGKAWFEAGGIMPFGLQLTGGYEYHFKEGEKSSTSWLPVDTPGGTRNILPAAKAIDEQVHILRLDAGYEWAGFRLDDNFRFEFYDLKTRQTGAFVEAVNADASQIIRDQQKSRNLANAFKVEKQPLDWLLLSAGYLYTRTDGDTAFSQTPVNAAGQPVFGILWNGDGITLEQSSHVFNANAQFGIWEQMTLSAGLQTDWSRQRVFGGANLDFGDPSDPLTLITNRARIEGEHDRFTSEEKLLLRNTQLPFTVLYAEMRFRQEEIDTFETQEESTGLNLSDFQRDTVADRDWKQYRAGFNVSPWTRMALSAYAQRRDHDDSFNHRLDEEPRGNSPGQGYPAFITARDNTVDEVGAKLVLRPSGWLKTTLGYKVVTGDYRTTTDSVAAGPDSSPGGSLTAAEYDAHIYSFNATLTPWRRLHLFSTFAFQDTRTLTADNGSASVAPWRGHIYSVLTSAAYVLNERTDLNLSYNFSNADYGQNNEAAGLPLGIDYRSHTLRAGVGRRFWKRYAANFEYVWSRYDEPASGGFNDYTANGVFGTLRVRWD
jgi:hypothetical protein